jgi:transposase, IS30 family
VRLMLMSCDREEISRGLAEGLWFTEIALRIRSDPSAISRDGTRQGSGLAASGQPGAVRPPHRER